MKLRKWIGNLAKRLENWSLGESVADYTLHLPADAADQTTKEYVDEWGGNFVASDKPGFLASIDKKGRPDRVLEGIPMLPTGAYSSGPTPAESKHLNELYNNSDNPGMLPTGHYYLFIDGRAVDVVKNMQVEGNWDSIYFDTWNRHGFRVNYEQDENG